MTWLHGLRTATSIKNGKKLQASQVFRLRCKHAGVDTMICMLRSSYWIVGLRRLAKRVKRECVSCQRQDSQACNQKAGPLSSLRVSESPPFSVTRLDFAGPLYASDLPGQKLYFLLFTCTVVRVKHLELVDSLTVSDCMLAICRFLLEEEWYTHSTETMLKLLSVQPNC